MTTQYTPTLKLALPVTGELSGTWGDIVNDNITSMIEQAIAGLATINTWTGNAHTLTTADGTTSESRCAMLVAATGGGAPTAAAEIICPAAAKLYVLQNNTSFAVTLKTSAGTGVAVAAGNTAFLFCDGTNVNACVTTIVDGRVTGNLTVDGNATINGNTTLGNATSDTITATARFASVLAPSADNTYDLGSTGNSWKDLYIDGTAYLALVDINGGTIDGVSIGASTAATLINVDNLRLDGNTLSSTDTNGNVVIAPNGTGDVQLDADTVRVGDSGAAAVLTSNGAGALTVTTGGAADLTLSTNSGTDSGTVVIANGANGNITLTPNGTGDVIVSADRTQFGDSNTDTTLTTNGTGSLNLTTNNGTNSGTIQIAQGVNGNITLTPNGTGSVSVPKLVVSTATATRIPYVSTGGLIVDSANLTFNGTDLTVSGAVNAGSINATTLDLTNLEVTNIKAKDGTASITLADSTGVASFTANPVMSGGTANGVAYLNGSKVLTTGSALTYNGTNTLSVISASGSASLTISAPITATGTLSNQITFQDTGTDKWALGGSSIGLDAPNSFGLYNYALSSTALYIDSATNNWTIPTGTVTIAGAFTANGGAVFNENSGDYDFRVESNDNTHMLFVDAGNNRVGINNSSPVNALSVTGQVDWSSYRKYSINRATTGNNFLSVVWAGSKTFKGVVRIGVTYPFATTAGRSFIEFLVDADTAAGGGSATLMRQFSNFDDASNYSAGVNYDSTTGTLTAWYKNVPTVEQDATVEVFVTSGSLPDSTPSWSTSAIPGTALTPQFISNSGNVAVGTASPGAKLHSVQATGGADSFWTENTATNNVVRFRAASTYDNYLDFYSGASSGALIIRGAGTERLRLGASEAVFNDPGNDYDFRVESDTNAYALFVDAGNSRVGINQSAPETQLHIGNTSTTASNMTLAGEYQSSGYTNYNAFNFQHGSFVRARISSTQYQPSSDSFAINLEIVNGSLSGYNNYLKVNGTSSDNGGSVIINEGGLAEIDFRVESDSNTHMLFVDAGNNCVGIASSAPGGAGNLVVNNTDNTRYAVYMSGVTGNVGGVIGAQATIRDTTAAAGVAGFGGLGFTSSPGTDYVIGKRWNTSSSAFVIREGGNTQDYLTITAGQEIVINDTSNDIDFRVESDSNTNALFVDAGLSTVCVNGAGATSNTDVAGFQNLSSNAVLSGGAGFPFVALSRTQNEATANNATTDAFRFLDHNSAVFGTSALAGKFYINATGASGANQFNAIYNVLVCGDGVGTGSSVFALETSVTRGTSPVASVALVNDGSGGAVKVQITYINNSGVVTGGTSRITFIGQTSTT
jgi:hypothetical protein